MDTHTQSSSTGSSAIVEWLLLQIAKGRILILFFFHSLVFAACYSFAYQVKMEGESIHATVHPHIVVTAAPQAEAVHVRHWLDRARHPNRAKHVRRLLRELARESSPEIAEPASLNDAPIPQVSALKRQLSLS